MTPTELKSQRARLAADTAAFLAKGGEIQQIPAGWETQHDGPAELWISTEEAAGYIGITPAKLKQWRKTNSSVPRNRQNQKEVLWLLASVVAFAETYQAKRKAA